MLAALCILRGFTLLQTFLRLALESNPMFAFSFLFDCNSFHQTYYRDVVLAKSDALANVIPGEIRLLTVMPAGDMSF